MTPMEPATRLICPLTCGDPAGMRAAMLTAARRGAEMAECRLDFLCPPPSKTQLETLLSDPPVELIVTNRPTCEGGRFGGDDSQRLELLGQAAKCRPAFVDVEMSTPREDWPEAPIILSHHDFAECPDGLDAIVERLEASSAAVNKIVFTATRCEDAFRALDVLRACKKPTIALAMGEAGLLSRILARKFGAFGTFAALETGAESAPAQPTIDELKNLYRWDELGAETEVYGVIGYPAAHSLSPAVHNAAFSAGGLNAVYLPLLVQPGADNFKRFMDALLARPWLDWRGLSVTVPHKENALAYVGRENCDELSARIGAINTIRISRDGTLRGENTDYAAAMDALCAGMNITPPQLAGKSVAVIGAGGVARAIVAGLASHNANVTIYNRTIARGRRLAEEFSFQAAGLEETENTDAEVLINCTSVGMHPAVEASPLRQIAPSVKVVFDTIYNPLQTLLLRMAARAGCLTVSGVEMFTNQAAAQFKIWTDRPAPREVMRRVVLERLTGKR